MKRKKKTIRVGALLLSLLIITLSLGNSSLLVSAAGTFSGGTGTEVAPYQISNPADLRELATEVNSNANVYESKFFILTDNIDIGLIPI